MKVSALQLTIVQNKKIKGAEENGAKTADGLATVMSGGQKLEEITLEGELQRIHKGLVESLPEKIR